MPSPPVPTEWAPLITGFWKGGSGGPGCTILLSYGALTHLLYPFVGHSSFSMCVRLFWGWVLGDEIQGGGGVMMCVLEQGSSIFFCIFASSTQPPDPPPPPCWTSGHCGFTGLAGLNICHFDFTFYCSWKEKVCLSCSPAATQSQQHSHLMYNSLLHEWTYICVASSLVYSQLVLKELYNNATFVSHIFRHDWRDCYTRSLSSGVIESQTPSQYFYVIRVHVAIFSHANGVAKIKV